jgi:hypothetical protein
MSVLIPLRIARAFTALLPLAMGGFPPAASAGPDGAARVIGTRMAHHDHYDRVVIEFDREVPFRPVVAPSERVRIIEVDSLAPHVERLPLTGSVARAGRVREIAFERAERGTRIVARGSTSNLQVFGLQSPPRIIIDFADSGGPVRLSRPLFPELRAAEVAALAGAGASERVELRIQEGDAQRGALVPTSGPRLLPIAAGIGVALLAALGAGAAVLAFGIWQRLRGDPDAARLAADGPVLEERGAAASPARRVQADLAEPAGRMAILERRHDEEVRARMALEERVLQLSEDLRALQQRATPRENPRSSVRA